MDETVQRITATLDKWQVEINECRDSVLGIDDTVIPNILDPLVTDLSYLLEEIRFEVTSKRD